MKKLSLLLVVFLVLGGLAFGQDEEASGPALNATGSLSFTLGDSAAFDDTTTALPVFSSTRSATATLGLATADEKVTGTINLNLLAPVTVDSTFTEPDSIFTEYSGYANVTAADYQDWVELGNLIDFWNANYDTTFAAGANTDANIFEATNVNGATVADIQDAVEGILNANTDLADADSDVGDLTLNTPVAPTEDATAGDGEFVFTSTAGQHVTTALGAVETALLDELSAAINDVIAQSSELDARLSVTVDLDAGTTIQGVIDDPTSGLTYEDVQALDAAASDLLTQALDLEAAALALNTPADPSVDSTVTQNFITSATLSLNQIGGVVDATFFFGGQHVSAGSINADGFGHSDATVAGYHGMTLGLSSGVVAGANAELGVYIDDNAVQASADDDLTTWTDESQSVVDPTYGMTVGGGYSTELAGLSVGGNAEIALYDLAGDSAFAFSVMPSVSGLGGSADIEISNGLGVFYTKAALSYSILGITPTATIHYISNGDNVLAYSADPTTVISNVQNAGGFAAQLGLSADLGQFLPIASSIGAGLDLAAPEGGDFGMAWTANASVTPLSGLSLTVSGSGDDVAGNFTEDVNWSTGLSYSYGIATVSASVGRSYSASTESTSASWSVGTSVSF